MTNSEGPYAPSLILAVLVLCGILWFTLNRSWRKLFSSLPFLPGSVHLAPKEPGSALHGSIQGKKDLSYYYAHAPRDTKEAPAAMPVHTPIAKETYTPGERLSLIKTFQFLDDKEFAKVYLPIEGLDKITLADVTSSFEPTTFTVTIKGLKSIPLQFTVSKLHKEINPEECVVKIMKTKVLVKLKKVLEGGDEDEEYDDEDTGTAPMDAETPIQAVEGGEVSDVEKAQLTVDQTSEAPPEPAAGAAETTSGASTGGAVDAPAGGDDPPNLEGLEIEGKAVAEPPGEEVAKEVKVRKKKEPRFPHWYSLRG